MDGKQLTAYSTILNQLKDKIKRAKIKAALAVNTELVSIYWEIGNVIAIQEKEGGWGAKIVEQLAIDLKMEFPDMTGFSKRNLRYMRDFSIAYPILQPSVAKSKESENQSIIFLQPLVAKIPWTHHTIILDKLKKEDERLFYIQKTLDNGWSKSVLNLQIEGQLHLKQGKALTNFKNTLPDFQSDLAQEMFKNEYSFDFLTLTEDAKERELENALIQNLKKFMLSLGRGFAYVGNQYNIEVGGDDFFLDLLFYNTRLHCYVVFELKVGEFKPEYAGKLNFYLNAVDGQVKMPEDNPTIGILLCKTNNKMVIEYALRGIEKPLGVADYKLKKTLPAKFKDELPSVQELEQELEKELQENKSPVEKRLQAVKERIKAIVKDEIQTPITAKIAEQLYVKALKLLYNQLIKKLTDDFADHFLSIAYSWHTSKDINLAQEQVDEIWKNGDKAIEHKSLTFTYRLLNFKKAGTDDLSEFIELKLVLNQYWYDFALSNYNNQQPFLKKMYHQTLTKEDIAKIKEIIMTKVLDRIEWFIEKINE